MCTSPGTSSGACSMSTRPQSKPAHPIASATRGLAELIHVPTGGCAPEDFSSCRNAFIGAPGALGPALVLGCRDPERGLEVVRAGDGVVVVRRNLFEAQRCVQTTRGLH